MKRKFLFAAAGVCMLMGLQHSADSNYGLLGLTIGSNSAG